MVKGEINFGDITNSMKSRKPEIHPLASAEASVCAAGAYCRICNGHDCSETYRIRAIDYAARALESSINYEINPPEADVFAHLYFIAKPVISHFIPEIEKYRDSKEAARFVREFVEDVVPKIMESTPSGDVSDSLLEILVNCGADYGLGIIDNFDTNGFAHDLRTASKKLRTFDNKTEKYLTSFIESCGKECDNSRVELENAKMEIKSKRAERDQFARDFSSLISLPLDMGAGVLEETSDSEFDVYRTITKMFLDSLKKDN
jgi:hypothetical protein